MCGICGEIIFSTESVNTGDLLRMRDALVHRGPDDCGELVEGRVGLGHRRLSIIDLSPLGRQPMDSACGSHAIVFNGEIYNYAEIRRDLEPRGVAFRGGSDTEVAVNAVAEWGIESALSRFVGMFALAIWDRTQRQIYLVRDRVGVKPLYYARLRDRLLFSSEVRSFLKHPHCKAEINRRSLARYLTLGYFPGRETIYKNIFKLLPGEYLTVGTNGSMSSTRYWSLDEIRRGSFAGSYEDAGEELTLLMRDAFNKRLVSDVPVGHFLSGGIDSSLVSAVLRKDLGVDITNFTIGFTQRDFNEAESAKAVSKFLGVRHEVRYVDPIEARKALAKLAQIYDEPFGDASGIPTFILCGFACEQVKVALSADGGDEQFSGYTGYSRYPALMRKMSHVPMILRKSLAGVARKLPCAWLSARTRNVGDSRKPQRAALFEKFLELGTLSGESAVPGVYARKGFAENEAALFAGLDESLQSFPPETIASSLDSLPDALMRMDFAYWLPEDVLLKVDRASMHNSLECREPLLDHRIAEFAFSLPLEFLQGGVKQKRILRDALVSRVPRELIERPKRGFEIPLYDWLKGPWRETVEDRLSTARLVQIGLVDPDAARAEVASFLKYPGRDPMRTWLLLMLQLWADCWLTGN
jgi:asparagine synthase (glutamine-hydrolysing)